MKPFSPGPWTVTEKQHRVNRYLYVIGPDLMQVCQVVGYGKRHDGNAALIAVAPDLLEFALWAYRNKVVAESPVQGFLAGILARVGMKKLKGGANET